MKNTKLIIGILIFIAVTFLGIYFLTPQELWVPSSLKRVVYSCYRENSNIPVISTKPECCYGLHKESISNESGLSVIGAMTCKK